METKTLPQQIEAAMLRLIDIDEERNSKEAFLRKIESKVTLDLTGAKDDKGKLILTNDKQREAAIAEYLEANEDFRKLYAERRTLDRERAALLATLERLRIEVKLHILECEQRNAIAALKVADAIWNARQTPDVPTPAMVKASIVPFRNGAAEPEIDMPF
jgi:predicted aminopeptidase